MTQRFEAIPINDPFGDPGVYVDFAFERRAMLFDLGDLSGLSQRKLLRVTDAFVSHTHIDHFCGFDQLLRGRIGSDSVVRLYGPPGFASSVSAKLAGYNWNLIGSYSSELLFVVNERVSDNEILQTKISSRDSFKPGPAHMVAMEAGCLLAEPGLRVRSAALDHGITSVAYTLEESEHINILRNRVDALGLQVGGWLNDFKTALRTGASTDTPVRVEWLPASKSRPETLPLGTLAEQIASITRGQKIAYVVDARHTPENQERIVDIARDADTLFIESHFIEDDADIAAQRNHLTATQAGRLARRAGVHRVVPIHFSPRYANDEDQVRNEALDAFGGPPPSPDSASGSSR
jgi:ribonuclease Z